MKERIVIEKEVLCRLLDWVSMQTVVYKEEDLKKERKIVLFGKEYKAEKEPSNWEEFKELCKEFGEIEIIENNIYFRGMTFLLNGNVEDFEGNIIGENRTPQQMWAIIKNLIGE